MLKPKPKRSSNIEKLLSEISCVEDDLGELADALDAMADALSCNLDEVTGAAGRRLSLQCGGLALHYPSPQEIGRLIARRMELKHELALQIALLSPEEQRKFVKPRRRRPAAGFGSLAA